NTDVLRSSNRFVNVIDGSISHRELGRFLVLAAQSSGIDATEPYWFLAWTNLFGSALTVLEATESAIPTLNLLVNSVLYPALGRRRIEKNALYALDNLGEVSVATYKGTKESEMPLTAWQDTIMRAAQNVLAHFNRTSHESVHAINTIDSFIRRAYG